MFYTNGLHWDISKCYIVALRGIGDEHLIRFIKTYWDNKTMCLPGKFRESKMGKAINSFLCLIDVKEASTICDKEVNQTIFTWQMDWNSTPSQYSEPEPLKTLLTSLGKWLSAWSFHASKWYNWEPYLPNHATPMLLPLSCSWLNFTSFTPLQPPPINSLASSLLRAFWPICQDPQNIVHSGYVNTETTKWKNRVFFHLETSLLLPLYTL